MEYLILAVLVIWGVVWLRRRNRRASKAKSRLQRSSLNDELQINITISSDSGRQHRDVRRSISKDSASFWAPQGRTTNIQGYSIDGGLLYVGKNLSAVDGHHVEPALINPSLKVDHKNPDYDGAGMSYWPSYNEITPSNRAGYLAWLAGGRKDPDAYIGYVFLYFYGLERRVLHDKRQSPANDQESIAIFNEVERLLALYGDNRSFAGYASGFLSAIAVGAPDLDLTAKPPITYGSSYDIPAPLKVGLGQFAKTGKSIPPDWALAWVTHDPETRLRTPARRCRAEFGKLFQHLYKERYGQGLVIKPNKTPICARYHPATGSIHAPIDICHGANLPDITVIKRPRTMLTDLANQATDKLDAYSRSIGKDGSGRDSLHSVALLPSELDTQIQNPSLEALRQAMDRYLSDGDYSFVPAAVLTEHVPINKPDRFSKKEATLVAQLLGKVGAGFEPDVRFSGIKPRPDERIIVFRQNEDASSAPSQAFEAATIMLRLGAMVSAADGEVSHEEKQSLEKHITTTLSLDDGERRRLHAHMQWLLAHDRGMAGLKSMLDGLAAPQRETLGEYLITVAAADGRIDPAEIKILEKLYTRLGLDPDRVVSQLHDFSAEPVTVKPPKPNEGYSIPQEPGSRTKTSANEDGAALDPDALQRKLADTAKVSDILHNIFADGETESTGIQDTQPHTNKAPTLVGLDAEHSAFLLALTESENWEHDALEMLAGRYGLMLEGALDTVNEAAFDRCDAPCIEEGDNGYTVDLEIYEEMTA